MKTFLIFLMTFFCTVTVLAQDVKTNNQINLLLSGNVNLAQLQYPQSVIRFYTGNNSDYAWFNNIDESDQSELAMLLLESSCRFGLSLSDYHLKTISLEKLRKLKGTPTDTSEKEKSIFDIFLTDALITFINHLHFGKFNPSYNSSFIDKNTINGFQAEKILLDARKQKDFLTDILKVQPKLKAYSDFQDYLNRVYTKNDCMDSQAGLEKIIINMERLRWINNESVSYILINIPSYRLTYYQKDIVYDFKIIVGKPATKTPILESKINLFTTAPDWKVPQSIFVKEMLPKITHQYLEEHHYSVYDRNGHEVDISSAKLKEIRQKPYKFSIRQSSGCDNALGAVVFRFTNSYGVYLHDTSQKQLFNKEDRALSHGCIRVENAQTLASLLLKYDDAEQDIPSLENAMINYKRKDFVLQLPVPIVITYMTCVINDGKPVIYNDIYQYDTSLESKFNFNK